MGVGEGGCGWYSREREGQGLKHWKSQEPMREQTGHFSWSPVCVGISGGQAFCLTQNLLNFNFMVFTTFQVILNISKYFPFMFTFVAVGIEVVKIDKCFWLRIGHIVGPPSMFTEWIEESGPLLQDP